MPDSRFPFSRNRHVFKLYQMAELYPKVFRNIVLIIAMDQGIREIPKVKFLKEHGFEKFYQAKEGHRKG